MAEKVVSQLSAKAYRCFCREILRCERCGKTQHAEHHQHTAHTVDVRLIGIFDTYVDDVRHNYRHYQLKYSFEEFAERAENALYLIIFQIAE